MKLLFPFILSPIFLFAQFKNHLHGTEIVSLICKDGIILAADSRASFTAYDSNSQKQFPYAAIDSTKKIFKLGSFQIGISGNLSVGNDFWSVIINKYNNKYQKLDNVDSTFSNFIFFIHHNLKIPDSLLYGNVFMLAGYEDGIPVVTSSNRLDIKLIQKKHKLLEGFCSNPIFNDKLVIHDKNLNCEKITPVVVDGFKRCSDEWKNGIGGPLNIIKISPNNSTQTLASFNFIKFNSLTNLEKSILSKKTKVIYFLPQSEEMLHQYLSQFIK